ncbi:peptide chain release factor-like protein [Patescibacteria group bacterium]|nr:peptide chain release factor-like protein [Patescibacteria group bacterium]
MKKKYLTDQKSLNRDTTLEFRRASGPGGQRRNRRETGVRLHHIPSGVVVIAEELASQARNRDVAFKRLKERLMKLNKPRKRRIPTQPPPSAEEKRIRTKHWKTRKKELRRPSHLEQL